MPIIKGAQLKLPDFKILDGSYIEIEPGVARFLCDMEDKDRSGMPVKVNNGDIPLLWTPATVSKLGGGDYDYYINHYVKTFGAKKGDPVFPIKTIFFPNSAPDSFTPAQLAKFEQEGIFYGIPIQSFNGSLSLIAPNINTPHHVIDSVSLTGSTSGGTDRHEHISQYFPPVNNSEKFIGGDLVVGLISTVGTNGSEFAYFHPGWTGGSDLSNAIAYTIEFVNTWKLRYNRLKIIQCIYGSHEGGHPLDVSHMTHALGLHESIAAATDIEIHNLGIVIYGAGEDAAYEESLGIIRNGVLDFYGIT